MTERSQRNEMDIFMLAKANEMEFPFVRLKSSEATAEAFIFMSIFCCCVSQHFIRHNNAIVNLFHVLRVIHFRPLKIH